MATETPANGGDRTVLTRPPEQQSLFDLRLLIRELWRWKWVVLLVTLIGAAVGVNDARNYSPKFEAQMVVASADAENPGIPAGGAAGLFGAAQSFGLIGSSSATLFDHFKQTIGSRGLADVLQEKHGLLQKVFKGSWDATNKSWIQPKVDENSIRQRIRQFFHLNSPRAPDRGVLANYIGGAVKVRPIVKTPFFLISVEHRDRDFALYLLETVYKEADELLAKRDRHKQARNHEYIKAQLEKTQLAEVRTTLLAVLMHQEQKAMLVNSEPPYTINILESPWVTAQPKEPHLATIIAKPTAVAFALVLIALTLFVSFRLE